MAEYDLWGLEKQMRELRDCLAARQSVWDDQAARSIRGRYLDPLDGLSEKYLAALQAHQAALDAADARADRMHEDIVRLNELANDIMRDHPELERQVQSANASVETTRNQTAQVDSALAKVREIIDDADRVRT